MTQKKSFWQNFKKNFPAPVAFVIAAMTLEYAAFGLSDAFASTISEMIVHNFFLVGAVYGVMNLSLVASLFFLSEFLEIFPPIRIVILGKIIVFLALIGYFFAAVFQSPILLFAVAIFNGFGTACREIGSREILLEHCTQKNASTILGWNSGLRDGLWSVMILVSGFLLVSAARFFEISIAKLLPGAFVVGLPFLVVGLFLLLRVEKKLSRDFFQKQKTENSPHRFSFRKLFDFFRLFPKMNLPMKFAMILLFFLQIIAATTLLFLPLLAIKLELNFTEIGLLMGIISVPLLFSSLFSIFEDRGDRLLFIVGGLLLTAFLFFSLAKTSAPLWIGIFSMFISFSLAIIRPASLGLIAANIDHRDAPAIATLQVFFNRLGTTAGSFGIGFVAQKFGISNAFFLIGSFAIFFAIIAIFVRFHFFPKKLRPHFFKIHPLDPKIFSHFHHHS